MGRMAEWDADAEEDRDLTYVGGRIRYARKRARMSQQELANAMPAERRKTRGAIAQYEDKENGNLPPLQVIEDLALILGEDPRYLAFGGSQDPLVQSAQGQHIPVYFPREPNVIEHAVLPRGMLAAFSANGMPLSLVQLSVDAPHFGFRALDFLLLDVGAQIIQPDGQVYAVNGSAGSMLVRGQPSLVRDEADLEIIDGHGAVRTIKSGSIDVMGRLVATLCKFE